MACIEYFKGPINSINQVIYVINQLIDRICATFGFLLSGTPNTLSGYDASGDPVNVTVGEGLLLEDDVLSANDFLSGVYLIESGESFTIPIKRQSINKGGMVIDGDIVIDGQLFMEA